MIVRVSKEEAAGGQEEGSGSLLPSYCVHARINLPIIGL